MDMYKEVLNLGHNNAYWIENNNKIYGSVISSYLKDDGWHYEIFSKKGSFIIMNNRIGVDIFRAE